MQRRIGLGGRRMRQSGRMCELGSVLQQEWWKERAARVEAHRVRIQMHLAPMYPPCPGKRSPVYCWGLRQRFDSMHEAARFTHRTAANIRRAVETGGRCAGYRWRISRSPRLRTAQVQRRDTKNHRANRARRIGRG